MRVPVGFCAGNSIRGKSYAVSGIRRTGQRYLLIACIDVKIPTEIYLRNDVVKVARELLGKVLCTHLEGTPTAAIIAETEAYAGVIDRASHAFEGRRTRRTEPMFRPGGIAYVYLCYGIHHLFNVVTGEEGTPHAVLVRAGSPVEGVETMLSRRRKDRVDKTLMGGPGTFSQALGIRTSMTGSDLSGNRIWIEDRGIVVRARDIEAGPRIGVDYAGDDARKPFRFVATTWT